MLLETNLPKINIFGNEEGQELRNKKFCGNCIWVSNDGLCPFSGCPKLFGWLADKKAEEGRKR
jgi:hypothetical protein